MGRRKGSRNKATIERERAEKIARLERESFEAGDRRDGDRVDAIERELAELRGQPVEEESGDDEGDEGGVDGEGHGPDAEMVSHDVGALIGQPLTEEERALAQPEEATAESVSSAPMAEDLPPPQEPATAEASEVPMPPGSRPDDRPRGESPRKGSPRKGGAKSDESDRAKRELAAVHLGGLIDMGLDYMAMMLGSDVRTADIATGRLMKDGTARGVPYDIDPGAASMTEALKTTLRMPDGSTILCTPGRAIAYNLAGQGSEVTDALAKFLKEHEETLRVTAAAAVALGWGAFAFNNGRQLRMARTQAEARGHAPHVPQPAQGAATSPIGVTDAITGEGK